MKIQLYLDSADLEKIAQFSVDPRLAGVTTNPSLMRGAGVTDYAAFARTVLTLITDKPVSFQVFASDLSEMERQAHCISHWADNAIVKVPIVNAQGQSSLSLIQRLSHAGMRLNITAITMPEQVQAILDVVHPTATTILSIFTGRIADTGRDPLPIMQEVVKLASDFPQVSVLWASVREVISVMQADQCGCDVITLPPKLWNNLLLLGKALDVTRSTAAVQVFSQDAQLAGYAL